MREIVFYRTVSGRCPVEQFLDSLNAKQSAKATWTLGLIEELEFVPQQYFKEIGQIRTTSGRSASPLEVMR